MSYGPVQVFTAGIASGASTSSYIDLGKAMVGLSVRYVTMSTGALVTVYGSDSAAGTYYPVQERISTATAQFATLQIPTTTSGSWASFNAPAFQFIQLVTSAVVSGGVSFTVLGKD